MIPRVPTRRVALAAAGSSKAALDAHLRAARTVALYRGVHVDARVAAAPLVRFAAALATQSPSAVLSHRSAAVALGLRWRPAEWSSPHADVDLTVAVADAHRHRDGLRLHRTTLAPDDVTCVGGLLCTTATRTLIDLARDVANPPLLVVQLLDGAVRDGATTAEALGHRLAAMRGARNVRRARDLVGRCRVGVDSPKETELRLLLEDGGVTGLETNVCIRDDGGNVLARADVASRKFLLWGEYDGFEPHTERSVFRGDRVGDRWLDRRGWQVLRFVDIDLVRPLATARDWRAAEANAPARIAAMDSSRSPEVANARRMLGLD